MSALQLDEEAPAELGRLGTLIQDKPEGFAIGEEELRAAALTAAKYAFDMGECYFSR